MSRTHHHGEWKPWVKRPAGTYFAQMEPSWWNRMFNNRPKRRRDKKMLHGVRSGRIDPENAAWERGNNKPHLYFW